MAARPSGRFALPNARLLILTIAVIVLPRATKAMVAKNIFLTVPPSAKKSIQITAATSLQPAIRVMAVKNISATALPNVRRPMMIIAVFVRTIRPSMAAKKSGTIVPANVKPEKAALKMTARLFPLRLFLLTLTIHLAVRDVEKTPFFIK